MTKSDQPAGRVYDAYLHLLDRQVVGPEDELICKVDDLELTDDGTGALYVSAILTGPAALGPRIGGIVGRAMLAIQRRLSSGPEPGPGRIDFAMVSDIGTAVTVTTPPGA